MTPEEANQFALSIVRQVLDAAHPFELTIEGKRVQVSNGRREPSEWPEPIVGISPENDGEWPAHVVVADQGG